MLYYEGLEDVIFTKHEFGQEEPDELIIISGFLGPAPVERLIELPFKTTVIGGMYSSGVNSRLFHSLQSAKNNNPNLSIYYSQQEIHSKIYIWKKKSRIMYALIGSANFSSKGLRTEYRESLADATRDTYAPLERYYKFILENSTEEPSITTAEDSMELSYQPIIDANQRIKALHSFDIPLYKQLKNGDKIVPESSGLNWGRARLTSNAHVAKGDAYIRLPKEILRTNQNLINPLDPKYTTPQGRRKRNSDPVELIWDDGITMEASLEGVQVYNGREYPKQLASYSSRQITSKGERISKKSILGRYLRNRLGVDIDDEITIETLERYGRDTITLSLIEDGVYFADFSI